MTRLSLRDVWMEYRGQIVLEKVNLQLDAGEFCAVVGPSGCGKTTLLRLLLSTEQPTRGSIEMDGKTLAREPRPDRGVVFQRYSVFPHLRVIDNLLLGPDFAAPITARLFGAARRRRVAEADTLLESVGLLSARRQFPAQLSGGMQQRLALAQALMMRPRLLLLDEPFGALDPGIKADMHGLLTRLWRTHGMSVIMVTHDLAEAFSLATRVIALDKVAGKTGATVTFDIKVHRARVNEKEEQHLFPKIL